MQHKIHRATELAEASGLLAARVASDALVNNLSCFILLFHCYLVRLRCTVHSIHIPHGLPFTPLYPTKYYSNQIPKNICCSPERGFPFRVCATCGSPLSGLLSSVIQLSAYVVLSSRILQANTFPAACCVMEKENEDSFRVLVCHEIANREASSMPRGASGGVLSSFRATHNTCELL